MTGTTTTPISEDANSLKGLKVINGKSTLRQIGTGTPVGKEVETGETGNPESLGKTPPLHSVALSRIEPGKTHRCRTFSVALPRKEYLGHDTQNQPGKNNGRRPDNEEVNPLQQTPEAPRLGSPANRHEISPLNFSTASLH
jgi:hypothetical protein